MNRLYIRRESVDGMTVWELVGLWSIIHDALDITTVVQWVPQSVLLLIGSALIAGRVTGNVEHEKVIYHWSRLDQHPVCEC